MTTEEIVIATIMIPAVIGILIFGIAYAIAHFQQSIENDYDGYLSDDWYNYYDTVAMPEVEQELEKPIKQQLIGRLSKYPEFKKRICAHWKHLTKEENEKRLVAKINKMTDEEAGDILSTFDAIIKVRGKIEETEIQRPGKPLSNFSKN